MSNFQPDLPSSVFVKKVIVENNYTKSFDLDLSYQAKPGQFGMIWLPGFQDKPFSLAQADPVRFTIAAVGPLSSALHRLQAGDTLWVRGPLGSGYDIPSPTTNKPSVLLIGGGYGVAPLLFLAKKAMALGYQVGMIIGAGSKADLLLADDFRKIGAYLFLTTEDGSEGIKGRVTDAIPTALAQLQEKPAAIYSCGPTGMLAAVSHYGERQDIPVQVAWESHMRCGIGLCGSCEVGEGWLTCLDGPVFPFDPLRTPPK
ncbi:MAG: dihydroorotate dehydrogenase electron transfer subunit [Chloroflexota bacterium]